MILRGLSGATPSAVEVRTVQFAVGGFGYGLRQSFLKVLVTARLNAVIDWLAVDRLFSAMLPSGSRPDGVLDEDAGQALARRVLHWTCELQRAAGHPIFDEGKILLRNPEGSAWQLAVPAQDHVAADRALRLVCKFISRVIDDPASVGTAFSSDWEANTAAFVAECPAKGFSGSNTLQFLKAAHERWLPWVALTGSVYQIGTGSRSRWIDSSFTDATSVITSHIARNKMATAQVLRQAGIPVPDHARAESVEEAVRIANRMGYPVVVKPLDKDGGLGVAANVRDAEGVQRAFKAARKFSNAILVEKHIDGRDYRLVVFQGKLIWALERVPGGVTGDGVHSIRELVERVNADPRRSKLSSAPLNPLDFDAEALALIEEAGLDAQTVLAEGQWLRLRQAANVASGGMPVGVFERVHPANRSLAERAARALRLDIAGVDMLLPDIELPWTDTGAAICEVNAAPTFGTTTSAHLYGQVLDRLFASGARVPIAAIVGLPASSAVPSLVERILTQGSRRVGIATSRSVQIDGEMVVTAPASLFMAARTLLNDTTVDAALVLIDDDSPLDHLLPFDLCSVLCVASDTFTGKASASRDLVRMMVPMCGQLVMAASAEKSLALVREVRGIPVTVASSGMNAVQGIPGALEVRAEWGGKVLKLLRTGTTEEISSTAFADLDCSTEEIALAVSIAAGLGCPGSHVRSVCSQIRPSIPTDA